jgi:tetratricopeptide (TPR) repeat protein
MTRTILLAVIALVCLHAHAWGRGCLADDDSVLMYRTMIRDVEAATIIDSCQYVQIHMQLSDLLNRTDSVVAAEECLLNALSYAKDAHHKFIETVPWINIRLAIVYRRLGEYSLAKNILIDIVQSGVIQRKKNCLFTAMTLQELGILLFKGVQIDESDLKTRTVVHSDGDSFDESPKRHTLCDVQSSAPGMVAQRDTSSYDSQDYYSEGDQGNQDRKYRHKLYYSINVEYGAKSILSECFDYYRQCDNLHLADLSSIANAYDSLSTADDIYNYYAVEMYDSLLLQQTKETDISDKRIHTIRLRLAKALERKRDYERAAEEYKQLLTTLTQESPDYQATSIGFIGKVAELLSENGDDEEALKYARQHLELTLLMAGRRSVETVNSMELLCRVAYDADSNSLAEQMRIAQLNIIDSLYGPTSSQAINVLGKYARVLWSQDKYSFANTVLTPRLIKAQRAATRFAIPEAELRAELAYIRYRMHLYKSADTLMQDAVDTMLSVDEPNDTWYMHLVVGAWIKNGIGDHDAAIELLESAKRIVVNTKGDDSKRLLVCYEELAPLYERKEQYDMSVDALEEVVRIVHHGMSTFDTARYVKAAIKSLQLRLMHVGDNGLEDRYSDLDRTMNDYSESTTELDYAMHELRILKAAYDGQYRLAAMTVDTVLDRYSWRDASTNDLYKAKHFANGALYLCLANLPDSAHLYLRKAQQMIGKIRGDVDIGEVKRIIARSYGDYYRLKSKYDSSLYWYDVSNDLANGGAIDRSQADPGKAATLFLMGRYNLANQLFRYSMYDQMSPYRKAVNVQPFMRTYAKSLAKQGLYDESVSKYKEIIRLYRDAYRVYSAEYLELLEEIVPVLRKSQGADELPRLERAIEDLRSYLNNEMEQKQ